MNNLLKLLGLIGTYGYLTKTPQDDEHYISDKELMEAENEQRKKNQYAKSQIDKEMYSELSEKTKKSIEDARKEQEEKELQLKLEALKRAKSKPMY